MKASSIGLYHTNSRDGRVNPDFVELMEFLIVDNISSYHEALGRPAWKDLKMSSIHHLCMKFSTDHEVAKVGGD